MIDTKKYLEISKYKLFIIGLYVILLPLFYIFTPDVLRYDFSSVYPVEVLLIIIATLFSIYILNLFFGLQKIGWRGLVVSHGIWVVVYAVFFAVPEEIIFRGIIQGALQNSIRNTVLVVVISSVIYGLAHLPNEAKGLYIRNWNWQLASVAFVIGLPLGLIFSITQSLLVPTLLHAFFLIFFKLSTKEATH